MHAAPRLNALMGTLGSILPAAGIGAWLYMQKQDIPAVQAAGVLAAFLIEAGLFLATGSSAARERLRALPPVRIAVLLTLLTPLTWLLAGGGEAWQVLATTAVTGFLAFWYLRFPAADIPVLVIYGALALGKVSAMLYFAPWPKAPTAIIGEFAWLRTLLFAVLLFRRPTLENFGFIPTKEDWQQGVKWFLLFVPVALAVGIPIGFAKLRTLPPDAARVVLAVVGTFLGHYIFVALREELVFRGLLQSRAGILATSLLFGAVHLPFGQFPNWRFAVVAAIAGWFYGRSYLATGSIRSAMITHALTNVMARVFLTT
jgi:uncharacterized protein